MDTLCAMRVEIEASRQEAEPCAVALHAAPGTTAGHALDALGATLGLTDAAGTVQGRSLLSGRWLDRDARLDTAGLLRGERLRLSVGLRPGAAPAPLRRTVSAHRADPAGRIRVDRPPRAVAPEPTLSVALPVRRRHRPPRRFPLGAMLIPLGIGLLLVVVTRRLEIALFSLFTPVMVVWNYVEERRARADEIRDTGKTYDEEVAAVLDSVRTTVADWETWLRRHHPSVDEVGDIVSTAGSRLWERQPGDPDHLRLRLGTATRRAPITLRDDHGGLLADSSRAEIEEATSAQEVPAVVDLTSGSLAVVADADELDLVGGWLLAQLGALHSPADVTVAAAVADRPTRDWVRWLPHVAHDDLPVPAVTDSAAGADRLLDAIERLGAARRDARRGDQRLVWPALVLVVDDRCDPDPRRVAAVGDLHDVGIHLVWLGARARRVPAAAADLMSVAPGARSAELVTHRGGERAQVVPEVLARGAALDLAAALAPLHDATDRRTRRSVPERVSLEEVLPDPASPTAIRRRWQRAPLDRTVARVGIGADGPVEVDLGPQGSHVLIGGTTGSGKSELLQAMVASLAAEYPPDRVSFLLVDYKGGAAFKDARSLPHCVGVVTDLDAGLSRRVMTALDAEIKRREHLLGRAGARDLTELRRADTAAAPADLLILVDEFATLAKELPEFVEGVVDVAARGRSLGLRLVLATQRPAGVVSDRIRANVGVRIALRVNDEEDSLDVIDVRDAAHIPRSRPGRAYLRLHRDVVELQTAFVGAGVRRATGAAVSATPLWADSTSLLPSAPDQGPTVLEAVVEATCRVAELGDWPSPHVPWLPALPVEVTAGALAGRIDLAPGAIPFALADLPADQRQPVVALDLAEQRSLLVFGTSRSGKTSVLRTIAASLVERHGPEEMQIHVLDFAGHGLACLEVAPQVSGVVGGDEPGRLVRLLRRLTQLVEQRRRDPDAPQTRAVVLIDSWSGAAAALERLDGGRVLERLERLVVDGPPVGVHVVITADRRAAVPAALTSTITTRLVLRMADRDDYAVLGVEAAALRHGHLPPGRGFVQGGTEVQVAVHASADDRTEIAAVAETCARAARRWPGLHDVLGRMPDQVPADAMPAPTAPWRLPVALGDHELLAVALDLSYDHALVAGPPRSGRSSALLAVARVAALLPDPPALLAVAPRRSPLTETASDGAKVLGPDLLAGPDGLASALDDVRRQLDTGCRVLCLVDDADALPDSASAALEELLRSARDRPLRMVAAAESRWALRAYGGLVPELRRAKQGLLLTPDVEMDGDLLGVRLRPSLEPFRGPGRGYLVSAGEAELVQVAHHVPRHVSLRPDPPLGPPSRLSPDPARSTP